MRPLDNITVLDLSHAVAGPHCTYHLGLMGADIIKVERPLLGDDLRHYTEHAGLKTLSAPFIAYNTGKRSITLDLTKPAAQEILARLIPRADVMVENFRPGVAKRLGFDCDSARQQNPRLIYCSISGFGQTGVMRDWPAYDHIIQSISGVMMMNGSEGGPPLKVGLPLADVFSGYVAAFAIVSALLQRERSGGGGQYIDVGMLDALMIMMNAGIVTYRLSGAIPRRTGNLGFRLVATSSVYKTRDGYIGIGANHQPQIEALFRIIGRPDVLADPRFADHAARMKNNEALRDLLTELFVTRSADELEPKLAQAKVPAGKVRTLAETVDHPHIRERDLFVTSSVPGLQQTVPIVGAGFCFEHDGPKRAGTVATIGEHTDEVLHEIGYSGEDVAGFRATGTI